MSKMSHIELVINSINLEEFRRDYLEDNMPIKDIATKHRIGRQTASRVVKELGLTRDRVATGFLRIAENKNKIFMEMVKGIDKDWLYGEYISKNRTHKSMQEELNVTSYTFDKILKYFNIGKDKKQSYLIGIETKASKFGSIEEYHKHAFKERKKTLIKKYGSMDNYKEHLSDISSHVWNNLKTREDFDARNEKTIQTCQEKYGVDFPCQRLEARSAGSNDSQPNIYFLDVLNKNNILFEREFTIGRFSYDFKIENTLIEINPTATHNTVWHPFGSDHTPRLDKNYHIDKTLLANENGFHCIHVFDWDDVNKVVNIFIDRDKVFAKNTIIKELTRETSAHFLNTYHLQGYVRDSIRIGLFLGDELISVMTFGKPRYNKNYQYELLRYASSKNVVGGAEKLFKYFLDAFTPKSIISYNDLSKFSGSVYSKLGFIKNRRTVKPSKHWHNMKTGEHFTDNLLRQRGADQLIGTSYGKGTDNEEILILHGFLPVYDVGQETYTYNV